MDNGAVYEGEVVDGKREGYGVCSWKDGSKYEGEWKNDKANGKGLDYPFWWRYLWQVNG